MNAYDLHVLNNAPKLPKETPILKCCINDGIELCTIIESALRDHGLFPALTGGLLYKKGQRKDIDIVIYRHRQKIDGFETIDIEHLLSAVDIKITGFHGFVTKALWRGFIVDIFNPETASGFNFIYDEDDLKAKETLKLFNL